MSKKQTKKNINRIREGLCAHFIHLFCVSVMDALVCLDPVGTVLYTDFHWTCVSRVPSLHEMWVGANTSTWDPVGSPDGIHMVNITKSWSLDLKSHYQGT